MRCIAVINQKGGVGKTTTTVNLGAALARLGHRVLLLDLDPQGNLSLHLDRQPGTEAQTMTYLLLEEQPLAELIVSTEVDKLSIVPADASLGGVEHVLANKIGRETVLREALETIGDAFDFVLLDCPPSLGVLSANALVAASEVVIPMQAEYFSLQGMAKLTEVIELVRARLNPDLQIARVLPCMLDVRTRLTAEVLDEIRRHFGDLVSRHPIRANVKLAEAPSFGRTIFEHDPECKGALDYVGFAREIVSLRAVVPAEPAAEEPAASEADPAEDATAPAAESIEPRADTASADAAPPVRESQVDASDGGGDGPGVESPSGDAGAERQAELEA